MVGKRKSHPRESPFGTKKKLKSHLISKEENGQEEVTYFTIFHWVKPD